MADSDFESFIRLDSYILRLIAFGVFLFSKERGVNH